MIASGSQIGMPKALRYARILVLIEVTRLLGLFLFSGIQRGILPSSSGLFGVGDALVAITAIPVWYGLGRGRSRAYALTMAWVTFGLVDLIYAVADGALSGLLPALSSLFGAGIVLIPFNIVVQIATFILLLNKPVTQYMGRP